MDLLEQISIKLNYLSDAARYLGILEGSGNDMGVHRHSIAENFIKLEQDFHLAATPLFVSSAETKTVSERNLAKILDKISFEERSRDVIHALMTYAAENGPVSGSMSLETNAAMRLLSAAQNIGAHSIFIPLGKDTCKCGAEYVIIPELSVRQCPGCSKIKTITGIVFDTGRTADPYGAKNKNRSAVMRHYLFWMNRIQAREKVVFEDKLIAGIQYVMSRDGDSAQDLKCERMREILKDPIVSSPTLNDHVPSLIVKLGGPSPPQLTSEESERHRVLFIKIIDLYDHRGNKPYYPYFIYKLIEIMFGPRPQNAILPKSYDEVAKYQPYPDIFSVSREKLLLLDYIHLQNPETVIRRDEEFQRIVERSDYRDGLYYTPTNLYLRVKI